MRRQLPAALLRDQEDTVDDLRQEPRLAFNEFTEHQIVQHPPPREIKLLEARAVAGFGELPVIRGRNQRPGARNRLFGLANDQFP